MLKERNHNARICNILIGNKVISKYNHNHPKRQYALQYVESSSIAF